MQRWPKKRDSELGGWRYLRRTASPDVQSDLSVTAWQIMFLRSAKNSGFEVPEQSLTDGVNYVLRTYDAKEKSFHLFAPPIATRALSAEVWPALASSRWLIRASTIAPRVLGLQSSYYACPACPMEKTILLKLAVLGIRTDITTARLWPLKQCTKWGASTGVNISLQRPRR